VALRVADEAERALLAPALREDGEVVEHGQLGREELERRAGGVIARPQRVPHRRDEERSEEHRSADDGRRRHPPGPSGRYQEQECGQQVQEVPIPHRPTAAVPVVRDDPHVGEPRENDREERQPSSAVAAPPEQE